MKKKKPSKHDGSRKNKDGLMPMQELFVLEYLKDLNATQAAARAGYAENSANEQGARLLANASIKKRVQDGLKEKFSRIDLTAERILLELFRMATVDIGEAYDELGQLKPIKEIPEDVRRCITGVEVDEIMAGEGDQRQVIGFNKKIKFTSKEKANELLAKYFKLLTDKIEHSGKVSLEDLIAGSNDASAAKD